jgi:hypothetical protein
MTAVKAAWMSKLMSLGPEQSFSPTKFVTSFYKYDNPTLNAFLSKDEYAGLKQLADISKTLQTAEKIAGNASGTGQVVGTQATIYLFARHPLLMTALQLGSQQFSNLYFNNKMFRNYLIEGLRAPVGSDKMAQMVAKISAIGNRVNAMDTTPPNISQTNTNIAPDFSKLSLAPMPEPTISTDRTNTLKNMLEQRGAIRP